MEPFHERLKILRIKKGLKQAEIADLVGVTASTWSNYEVGKSEPNIFSIVKISSVLGISIDELLGSESLIYSIDDKKKYKNESLNESLSASLISTNRAEEPSEEYVVSTNQELILRKKVEQVNELIERLNKVGSSLSKTAQEAANINVYINMVVDLKVQLKEKERLVNDLEAQLKACRQLRHKHTV